VRAFLLFPFTVLYYLINIIWDYYWRFKKTIKIDAIVISVGNITVGGSGKTTLAEYIARRLIEKGKKATIITKGYKRLISGPAKASGSKVSWKECGDEAAALAKAIPNLVVYVDSDKTIAARQAAADGYSYIIIDDGFQHRKLFRDIDIVCLYGNRPFGNGLLLPSGKLREPKKALRRADAIIAIDGANLNNLIYDGPIFAARKEVISVKTSNNEPVDTTGIKMVAFCGLGNPESFRKSLEEAKCQVTEFIQFGDHHVYDKNDIKLLEERLKFTKSAAAITTLKDIVKVEEYWTILSPLYWLQVGIRLENETEFYKLIRL
jgi:tetraacyldisaccharide 4'-kinase